MMNPPAVRGYRPFGISDSDESPVRLLFEEYEAIRLADYENMSQLQAAKHMDVSRPTFTRIYDRALKKLAKAMNEGRSFIIEGGNVHFEDQWYRCEHCHSVYKTNKKKPGNCALCGAQNIHHINPSVDDALYENEHCICDNCGNITGHKKGEPCRVTTCPNCGSKMRKEVT